MAKARHSSAPLAVRRVLSSGPPVDSRIVLVRGHRVILDVDIAELYGVPTKALKQAVRRNRTRFPADFLLELTWEEAASLRSQIVTLEGSLPGRGSRRGRHRKYRPFAFTEQGVAMLSGVLRSTRAVAVNIEIMRAFVRLRGMLGAHSELSRKIDALEHKYDSQFSAVFEAIRELMAQDEAAESKPQIGYQTEAQDASSGPRSRPH